MELVGARRAAPVLICAGPHNALSGIWVDFNEMRVYISLDARGGGFSPEGARCE